MNFAFSLTQKVLDIKCKYEKNVLFSLIIIGFLNEQHKS